MQLLPMSSQCVLFRIYVLLTETFELRFSSIGEHVFDMFTLYLRHTLSPIPNWPLSNTFASLQINDDRYVR